MTTICCSAMKYSFLSINDHRYHLSVGTWVQLDCIPNRHMLYPGVVLQEEARKGESDKAERLGVPLHLRAPVLRGSLTEQPECSLSKTWFALSRSGQLSCLRGRRGGEITKTFQKFHNPLKVNQTPVSTASEDEDVLCFMEAVFIWNASWR